MRSAGIVAIPGGALPLEAGNTQDIIGVALFFVVVGTQLRSRRARRALASA